ncbi:hypothetical protein J1N35_041636 [Gossypium stocksii]|uniref:UBN2 domain-containing protein n=1 Tax=Gossypium stocksii TaxID=47602 RepID=A0A9D3UHR6_9ROSI|nr:hypothetical protein J1N35_041636 [Gossypium stocksii]
MEIWDKLEVTHEGSNQVKKSNVGILTLNYETFTLKPEEDIKAMSDRFTIIINELKTYKKTYPNEGIVQKMLKSLALSWDAKVIAIDEAKNLETLSSDELIGSMLIHEMRLKGINKGEEKVEKKKVGVALKSTIKSSNSNKDVDEDEEMVMFARRFKRLMRSNRKRKFQKKEGPKIESIKEKDYIMCYEYKKQGTPSLIILNGRKEGQANKSLRLMLLVRVMRTLPIMKIKK